MSLSRRMTFVVIAGLVAGTVAHFADPSGSTGALVLLAAGLVLGELLVLRLENGTAVPLSYAVLLVLASTFPAPRYAGAVAGAELISVLLRLSDRGRAPKVHHLPKRRATTRGHVRPRDGRRQAMRIIVATAITALALALSLIHI